MRSILKYFLLIALLLLLSCDKSGLFILCSDCLQDEPTTADLDIKIDDSVLNDARSINIKIYSGNLEDSILLATFDATNSSQTYTVTINKKYTVTATYSTTKTTYIAVDSTIPRVKYVTDQCKEPCYFIYGKKIDLRLKYQ
jgi:hypothetical protein